MLKATDDRTVFIGLVRSMLNKQQPAPLPEWCSADNIWSIAVTQDMTALIFCAFNSMSPRPQSDHWSEWQKAFLEECMRSEVQMSDYHSLTEQLCSKGVKIIPLKGCILKDYYPAPVFRSMGDIDLLYEGIAPEKLVTLMEEAGYSVQSLVSENSRSFHDKFYKKPYTKVELHRKLDSEDSKYKAVLQDAFSRAVPDDEPLNLYHMSPEDFYVHVVAHAARHLHDNGLGIRILADFYILRQKYASTWDFEYIRTQLQSVGLEQFETNMQEIAYAFFDVEEKDIPDADISVFFTGGVYGNLFTLESKYAASKDSGKLSFMVNRIFPPLREMKKHFPILEKFPFLLPFFEIYRWGILIFQYRRTVSKLKTLQKTDDDYRKAINRLFSGDESNQ